MCEYCDFTNRRMLPVQYGCGYATIEHNEPEVGLNAIEVYREDDDVVTATFEIHYCPMCGRKLEENA